MPIQIFRRDFVVSTAIEGSKLKACGGGESESCQRFESVVIGYFPGEHIYYDLGAERPFSIPKFHLRSRDKSIPFLHFN